MSKIFLNVYEETRHQKPGYITAITINIQIRYVLHSFNTEYLHTIDG